MGVCTEHHDLVKTVNEIHGDVKVLVSEFKAMNGSLRTYKAGQETHESESKPYRHKIDTIWSVFHTIKWAIGLIFGTGILFKMFEWWSK